MAPSTTIHINPRASSNKTKVQYAPHILSYHKKLPDYNSTPLRPLTDLSASTNIPHIFLKDESSRFGLPSFKILGASWGIHRLLCSHLSLPLDTPLEEVGANARRAKVTLVTCTEGNWGRAVARMSRYLTIPAIIVVPGFMDEATEKKISSESETVKLIRIEGTYDDAIAECRRISDRGEALLVMDTSWAGWEHISRWVVDGYSTCLLEVDRQIKEQTGGKGITHAICSVGVGSWAQAITEHYKAQTPRATVITVEPDTAACLQASLKADRMTQVNTADTIMCGMNCGTLSSIAWPVLREGVDAAVTVSDPEAHESVRYLQDQGLNAGPCGAAPLAALRKLVAAKGADFADGIVVLFCTEGNRDYEIP
ncbi:tryptophan synthase beta subunit-like PLP-dependent enzyme [Patellaria atrata CBS 101060]|uniref:Tryptophan synthase beta subunit-like PLP-dependent enzyme n=1 Tax=Patellaria atrata CBS 101060 TaxID=1346257 RepID=A0A9P4S4Y6_9PEZI|nr:tryptophan synthase beta subunit-like PLP-dependent enzyme [Patellaria atrata CBS 101060]